jgi:hypothetical protein
MWHVWATLYAGAVRSRKLAHGGGRLDAPDRRRIADPEQGPRNLWENSRVMPDVSGSRDTARSSQHLMVSPSNHEAGRMHARIR